MTTDKGFEVAVRALYDGRASFTEFVQATRERWHALALYIMRRWRLPGWVSVEDIEQELLLAASKAVWDYEPWRGVNIARFLVWNSVDKAKKAGHKMRGASLSGNADANPSNYERPLCTWEDGDDWAASMLAEPPVQLDVVERAQNVQRALDACTNKRERHAIRALAEHGDIVMGALALYDDPDARLDCRLSHERQAVRVVERAAEAVAERLARGVG